MRVGMDSNGGGWQIIVVRGCAWHRYIAARGGGRHSSGTPHLRRGGDALLERVPFHRHSHRQPGIRHPPGRRDLPPPPLVVPPPCRRRRRGGEMPPRRVRRRRRRPRRRRHDAAAEPAEFANVRETDHGVCDKNLRLSSPPELLARKVPIDGDRSARRPGLGGLYYSGENAD